MVSVPFCSICSSLFLTFSAGDDGRRRLEAFWPYRCFGRLGWGILHSLYGTVSGRAFFRSAHGVQRPFLQQDAAVWLVLQKMYRQQAALPVSGGGR